MTTEENKVPKIGIRHLQAFLIFLNIVVVYVSRLNVSVAIVAMTNAETTNPNFPEYDWSEKEKSYILSSFYWGYVLTQFLGGYLGRRFGPKIVILCTTFVSAIFCLITPFCIDWGGWQIYCVFRVIEGLMQGMIFPCIHDHLAKWSPPHERNRLSALSHSGSECGTVLAMFTSGYIASSSLGWPGISYIAAGLCFGWCILWIMFAANNPPSSKIISAAELEYIETSLKRDADFHHKSIPIPWGAMATSVPLIALLITRCSESWGYSTIQAEIPSYMNGVLQMNIKSNALWSSMPYLATWVMSFVYLIAADIILKKEWLSLTALRKTFNTLSFWTPAVLLIGIGFLDEDQKTLAVALMTIQVGVNGGATIGSTLNSLDLSPNHAGILMGLINTISNCIPLVTPLVVGVIVRDEHNRFQWQIVFIISAAIFFLGNLVFIIWGTAVTQPWDDPNYMKLRDAEKSEVKEETFRKITNADGSTWEQAENDKKREILKPPQEPERY